MTAQVLATASGLGKAGDPGAAVRQYQMSVARQLGQTRSVRCDKGHARQIDERLALRTVVAVAQTFGEGGKAGFEFAA